MPIFFYWFRCTIRFWNSLLSSVTINWCAETYTLQWQWFAMTLQITPFLRELCGLIYFLMPCSPKVYKLMTAIKRTDISPISAESWTEHLHSHSVQPQESASHLIPGQSNLPTRHQLLSGQLRSGVILPSYIAVPPGPGGRYRNMNTTFQRNNERTPVYELPPIHTLATTIKKNISNMSTQSSPKPFWSVL